jgi:hypothetical protein
MTGTFHITAVVGGTFHGSRSRYTVVGYEVGTEARMEWFTTNQFLAAFLDQARHLHKPVIVTWQSIWWGEEVTSAEFGDAYQQAEAG